ncbi:MAG: hypothetical protein COA78_03365 [Blastopirellula sp.]|nr:MAG: hypothetical protein COA78_03365 [Blastopirellula sp.]
MEALISLTIISFASSILLLSVESTLESTMDAQEQTIAAGIADQLIDEIMGQHWSDPDDPSNYYPTTLEASSIELSGIGRSIYDDTGDYAAYTANPPETPNGYKLGQVDSNGNTLTREFKARTSLMKLWREKVKVYYVDPDDLSLRVSDSTPTAFRAVEVLIYHQDGDGTWRHILSRKRIFSYIPS